MFYITQDAVLTATVEVVQFKLVEQIMAFDAKVIKVMISCPNDVKDELKIIKEQILKWNIEHSEEKGVVYFPFHWKKDTVLWGNKPPQQTIDKNLLSSADLLISKLGVTH